MASFIKGKLKNARDAIGKKDYRAAEEAARLVLDYEPTNYNANVFLGLACLELGEHSKSEQAYMKAIEANPEQLLAWQGISKFYERTERWNDYSKALRRLVDLLADQNDSMKCAETLQKFIDLQRSHGTREELISALSLLIPSSSLYPVLSELPEPEPSAPTSTTTYAVQASIHNSLPTLEEIVFITEQREEENIKKEVDKRRMRLGASRPDEIKREVGREVWGSSMLPSLYEEILNHPNTDDDLRRSTESKLLRRKHSHLQSLPTTGEDGRLKKQLLSQVHSLSSGAILLGLPDELAWTIFIEAQGPYDLEGYDFRTLRRFFEVFPSHPLTKLVQGYFKYTGIPIATAEVDDGEDAGDSTTLSPSEGNVNDDPFGAVLDAFAALPDSLLAHRILAELYYVESDHENSIRVAESGLELLAKSEANYGNQMLMKAFKVVLATALIHLFSPKHHVRALRILDEVLSEDPDNIPCLMGRGYVLQHSDKWHDAEGLFSRVGALQPDLDVRLEAREERAWCQIKCGHLDEGTHKLRAVIHALEEEEGRSDQKARAWWRLGKALWEYGDDSREEAYKHFITSLKRSSTFAPAFTSLGIYYADVALPPDLDRSSKCFQKAFELDAREAEAARRLAEGFAQEREWDLVEVVARRTIDGEGGLEGGDSGKEKATSGRYLPTNAWAWKAVGVVELNRRNYPSSTQAFQVALRADQDDFLSWQRLGESYAKAGRHAASIKALARALELRPDDWMCHYLMGEVHRLMGQFQGAIDVFEDVIRIHPEEICVLLSLAETHLAHGRNQSSEGFLARAEASCVAALSTALELFNKSPGFRRVAWKTAADTVFELSKLVSFNEPEAVGTVLASLASLIRIAETDDFVKGILDIPLVVEGASVDGFSAVHLAVAAYNYRISLGNLDVSSIASAWYDLAVALNRFSTATSDTEKAHNAAQQANHCVQKALDADPGNSVYWNALGNLNFVEKPKMSQHAYIRALECDSKSALTWTNLGLLYLYHGDAELANEALFRAQTLDPDHVLAWVGQGLVATANGHNVESSALFGHAVGLSADVPAADLEFAKRAFQTFADPHLGQILAKELLLPPFHALDRYCKQRPNDSTALHLFGLVCERLDQMELALDLISKSIAILERSYEVNEDTLTEQRFALANGSLGRLKLASGDYVGAVAAFDSALSLFPVDDISSRMKTLRVHARFGSGLANLKLGELENALGMFESALEELPAEMVDVRGHVTVLLAQALWALGGDEARQTARGQLLECISADPENLTAMTILVAMGILDSDDSLVDAAVAEIQALTLDKRVVLDPAQDVSKLLVRHHLSQGRENEALAEAQRTMHMQPLNDISRRDLASLLLQQGAAAAAGAILATHQNGHDRRSLDVTLRIAAIAAAVDVRMQRRALGLAQRSVVLAPWSKENWKALAYVRCVEADG